MTVSVTRHDVDGELLRMLRTRMTTDEQMIFVDSFHVYLKYGYRTEFVVDLDDVYQWIGFPRKDHAKATLTRSLTLDAQYIIQQTQQEGAACHVLPDGRGCKETILMTVRGFKTLCLASNTDRAKCIREYYLTMEDVLMEHTQQLLERQRTISDDAQTLLEEQKVELHHYRSKTYEEVPKYDRVYINKAYAELHRNVFKLGIAIDTRRRESQFNTAHADGTKMLCIHETSNAPLAEKLVAFGLSRYRMGLGRGREHYNCELNHADTYIALSTIFLDTLASGFEHITRHDMCMKLMDKITICSNTPETNGAPATTQQSAQTSTQQITQTSTHHDLQPSGTSQLPRQPSASASARLTTFLTMTDAMRTHALTFVADQVTSLPYFKSAFKKVMRCKYMADPDVFRVHGLEVSEGRENLCLSCKQLAVVGCCPEYASNNRTSATVIRGLLMTPM